MTERDYAEYSTAQLRLVRNLCARAMDDLPMQADVREHAFKVWLRLNTVIARRAHDNMCAWQQAMEAARTQD